METEKKSGVDLVDESGKKIRHSATNRKAKDSEDLIPQTEEEERRVHQEGPVARAIESQTAKLPSDLFLWAGGAAIGLSALFMLLKRDKAATFVGHWAPTILILGLYNKLVKVSGSDRLSQSRGLGRSDDVLH